MHDGIELEKREIPSAVIITDMFIPTAKAQAAISGIPDYPFAVIPQPISRLSEKELGKRAETAVIRVIELLLNT